MDSIIIEDWMLKKGLRGLNLHIYAIIWQKMKTGDSGVSLGELADITGSAKSSLCRTMKKMVEENLLEKEVVIRNFEVKYYIKKDTNY